MAGSVLYTDRYVGYRQLGREFLRHEAVDHDTGEYVRYRGREVITSNAAENFFSQLKRSLDGTHHHVSKVHLARYLAEFDYRFTHRTALGVSDTQRMEMLVGATPLRRLTYRRGPRLPVDVMGSWPEGIGSVGKGNRSSIGTAYF